MGLQLQPTYLRWRGDLMNYVRRAMRRMFFTELKEMKELNNRVKKLEQELALIRVLIK